MKKMVLFLSLISSLALAAGGEHGGHSEGVPTIVFWQVANLVLIFAGIIYLYGRKILESFGVRQKAFLAESEKSKLIQAEAEKKLHDIKHKLNILETTADESVARARAEAADLKNQLSNEAKEFAEKIRREAQSIAQIEVQSAKRELHEELVKESVKQAREILKKDTVQSDQQRLQDQFSTQIEGVRL